MAPSNIKPVASLLALVWWAHLWRAALLLALANLGLLVGLSIVERSGLYQLLSFTPGHNKLALAAGLLAAAEAIMIMAALLAGLLITMKKRFAAFTISYEHSMSASLLITPVSALPIIRTYIGQLLAGAFWGAVAALITWQQQFGTLPLFLLFAGLLLGSAAGIQMLFDPTARYHLAIIPHPSRVWKK